MHHGTHLEDLAGAAVVQSQQASQRNKKLPLHSNNLPITVDQLAGQGKRRFLLLRIQLRCGRSEISSPKA